MVHFDLDFDMQNTLLVSVFSRLSSRCVEQKFVGVGQKEKALGQQFYFNFRKWSV